MDRASLSHAALAEIAFEGSRDALAVLEGGAHVLVNDPYLRLFDHTRAALIGAPFDALVAPADRSRVGEVLASARPHGPVEARGVRGDGAEIDLAIELAPRVLGGRALTLVTVRDVGDPRRAAAARAGREAAAAHAHTMEALGQLAAGIARDLGGSLSTIAGSVALARARAGGEADELLLEAERACARARDVADQLRAFARGGAPAREVGEIAPVVWEAAEDALRGTRATLRIRVARDVAFDRAQIGELVRHLARNAARAMPEGGVVTVAVEQTARPPGDEGPEGLCVRVRVEDQGPGVPEAMRARVFEPYVATRAGASGLGLAIAFTIARRHEGALGVEAAPGGGASFVLDLPAARAPRPTTRPPRASSVPRGLRVLAMDDEPEILRLLGALGRAVGADVTGAPDGETAVRAYADARRAGRRFDLVLLDLDVGGRMGGKVAVARLREIDPSVVAIVSSGYGDDPVMADHAAHGFRAALPKPYGLADFAGAIERAIAPR